MVRRDSENGAQQHAGILLRWNRFPACSCHLIGTLQEFPYLQTHDRRRNDPEVRKRRIPAADARHAGENGPEFVAFGNRLHFRPGVGYGDEPAAGLRVANLRPHALKEILLEDIRLQRASRFAGDDANRPCQIQFLLKRPNLRRVCRVQHVQLGKPGDFAEGHSQHFRAQARSAHAQQQRVFEFFAFDFRGQPLEGLKLRQLLLGDVQPARPFPFVLAGPERRVSGPESAHLAVRSPVLDGGLDAGRQFRGQLVFEIAEAHACTPTTLPVACSSFVNASAKSFTPSTTSLSVTSFIEMPSSPSCFIS